MNAEDSILRELSVTLPSRNGISFNFLFALFCDVYKKGTIKNSITHLKKREYVTFEGRYMKITDKGRSYIKERRVLLQTFASPFSKNNKKNLIVIFDIPENRKGEREWFRSHLQKFGYEMIQRSVWYGPSPLPEEFVGYVKSIELENAIMTFKATPLRL